MNQLPLSTNPLRLIGTVDPKKRLVIYSVSGVLLVIVAFFGWNWFSDFRVKRGQVADIITRNTEVYNSTTDKSKVLLGELKDLLDFGKVSDEKIVDNLNQLEKKIPEIDKISAEIEDNKKELVKGDNSDTDKLYLRYKEGLAVKQATIVNLSEFVKYQICVVRNTSTQYSNINTFSADLNKFADPANTSATTQEKAALVDSSNAKINENIQLSKEISGCFTDKYLKYLTTGMKQDISKDIDLYNKYGEATKNISDGLKRTDSTLLQTGTSQLLGLKDQNPIFFNSDGFKKAVQDPKKLLQSQAEILESQENKIKDEVNNLKGIYKL
jgi:hypothetical protein